MKERLEAGGVCITLDRETARLQFELKQKMRFWTADAFDGERWFASAENWRTFAYNGLTCARFHTRASTERGSCEADYVFAVQKGMPALFAATLLEPDAAGKPELPFEWMRLSVEGVNAVHTLNPRWSVRRAEMKTAISFSRNMILESEEGCAGFFHGGEPIFDPKKGVAKPDMWLETTGLTGFQPAHAFVLVYGDDASAQEGMERAANELYARARDLLCARQGGRIAGTEHRFTSGAISFGITENEHGAALTSMRSMGSERSFCLPLAQLYLKDLQTDRSFSVDTRRGWEFVRVFPENGGGRVCLAGVEGWPELSLELSFSLLKEQNRVEWTTHVINAEQTLTVLSASYPPSPWTAREASCFVPEHCGWVARNVTDMHFYRDGVYPRGWRFTMSYFAAYTPERHGNGFYCGLHDPQGAFRTMNVETDPVGGAGLFFARACAPGMGKGGNAFALPGKMVWQAFSGDWYDATLIYKDFVHKHARWLPKVGPEGREDTPQWAKELPLWVMDWMPNTNPLAEEIPTSLSKNGKNPPMEYWYEEPLKLKRALGVPIGYHVYNWHWIPFNNDYPYYLPAKKEFADKLLTLQQKGVRVMPYTNARLWDTHDRGGEDWHFSDRAKAWATKDASGKLFTEKYEAHEPDGSLCELAAMCPSSGVWKAELAGVLKELFGSLGVDGVYMDQIAAAAPYPCEDPGHHHLPGGGSWWAEQYELLTRRMRQIRGENGILTTEDNAEVYAAAMDGFLSWIWTFDNLVPAFSVIYAGYIIMFGRTTNGLKKGDEVFLKYETAEQLVFGGQLGWLNADVAERPREFAFLKKMVDLRWRYAPFFYKGEALRPAELETDRPNRTTTPMYFDTRLFEARQVLTGSWRLWDGTRAVLFLINCDTQRASFTAAFRAGGAAMAEGEGEIFQTERDGDRLLLRGVIEPESYLVLELTNAR